MSLALQNIPLDLARLTIGREPRCLSDSLGSSGDLCVWLHFKVMLACTLFEWVLPEAKAFLGILAESTKVGVGWHSVVCGLEGLARWTGSTPISGLDSLVLLWCVSRF